MSPIEFVDASAFDQLAREALLNLVPEPNVEAMLILFNLMRAANRVQHDLEINVHRPAGGTWAAFRVLFAVSVVGPITPAQLAHLSSVSAASMSSVLNTLERNGLVSRHPSTEDGRSVLVRLTDAGHAAVSELLKRNNERETAWAVALTASERKTLARLLHKLVVHRPVALTERRARIVPADPDQTSAP